MNAAINLRRLGLSLGLFTACLVHFGSHGLAQTAKAADQDSPDGAKWSAIKNDTYDQRAHFAAGAARLAQRLDEQVRVLKAKRSAMTMDTKDWDLAMKEVDDSRSYLADGLNSLAQANTPEIWSDRKDKVGEAWKRSQLAVDNMHTTVTD